MIQRLKSTSFWVSLVSAIFLILGAFGVEIGDQTASTVINGICSVLVMLGIATPPVGGKTPVDQTYDGDSTDDKTV